LASCSLRMLKEEVLLSSLKRKLLFRFLLLFSVPGSLVVVRMSA